MKSKNDFTLGILGGMGPMAGVEMQKRIIENTPARSDEDHIKMICFTNPKIKDRSKSIKEKRDFSEEIITSLKLMEKTGVDIGVISCNTAHADFEKIAVASAIPLMNMVEETVNYIKRNFPNAISVGVIATDGSVASGVYEKYLKENYISQTIPDRVSQKYIMDIIYGIKAGNSKEVKIEIVEKVIEDLTEKGAEIVILGCTELSILGIKGRNIIDPIDVVSRKIVDNYRSI